VPLDVPVPNVPLDMPIDVPMQVPGTTL